MVNISKSWREIAPKLDSEWHFFRLFSSLSLLWLLLSLSWVRAWKCLRHSQWWILIMVNKAGQVFIFRRYFGIWEDSHEWTGIELQRRYWTDSQIFSVRLRLSSTQVSLMIEFTDSDDQRRSNSKTAGETQTEKLRLWAAAYRWKTSFPEVQTQYS
jgi:hypothetical protein